ncbi:MAG: hypothetical protein V4693_08515 [Pseudomonadota bacterium]
MGRELQDIPLHVNSRRSELPIGSKSDRQHDVAVVAGSRITNMIASLPTEALRQHLDSLPLNQLRKVYEQLPSTRLKEVMDLLPSEQLKKLAASLPSDQIKRLLNESPSSLIKQLLASSSLENITKALQEADKLPSEISKASSDNSWIEHGGFSSSEALADLISSVPPVGKKVR